jgi:hypothetical protein
MDNLTKAESPTLVQPNYASQWQVDDLNRRMDRLEKKCRLMIAVMVDKKVLNMELAKVIFETSPEQQLSLIEWYLKEKL